MNGNGARRCANRWRAQTATRAIQESAGQSPCCHDSNLPYFLSPLSHQFCPLRCFRDVVDCHVRRVLAREPGRSSGRIANLATDSESGPCEHLRHLGRTGPSKTIRVLHFSKVARVGQKLTWSNRSCCWCDNRQNRPLRFRQKFPHMGYWSVWDVWNGPERIPAPVELAGEC